MPSKDLKINPDIAKEREGASFDVEELAIWLHGGVEQLTAKREVVKELYADPCFDDEVPYYYLSYQDQYDDAVKRSVWLAKKLKDMQLRKNPGGTDVFPDLFITGNIPQNSPFDVHFAMFIPAIEKQGTPEQMKQWLPLARECKILGTYAQTELGHGTFIRGLETRADYDPVKEEFVLNSPSLTAFKFWPGALGHTSNYAVVIAQLYTKDKHCGIQLFIVQLRDEDTHMPLPGIIIGDIGNKLGFTGVNNGYLGFKNVRIPRMNMLMRYSQVQPDGTFLSSSVPILSYLTMVYVRVIIISQSFKFLSEAATIATRYSAVRRQSPINPKEPEHQIMDHITQQLKLFPEIAVSFAIKFAAGYLKDMYQQVTEEISNGKLDRLAEIHALSCCLKAISTADSRAGVEILRKACGGHGYLLASNLPAIYGKSTAAETYEGENTVMLMQTSRYLMKAWADALNGDKLVPTVAYLSKVAKNETFSKWDGSQECMVHALQFAAGNKIRVAFNHLAGRKKRGMTPEEAANETSIELTQAAELHGRSFLAATIWQKLSGESNQRSRRLNEVLNDLLNIYLVTACLRNMGDILRFVNITEENLCGLQSNLEETLRRLRPNAVAIVDGFDYHDKALGSALGSYDGNVYERMFDEAQKNPMNKIPVQKSFHMYLKPFMKSNM